MEIRSLNISFLINVNVLVCKTLIKPDTLFCSDSCKISYFKKHKRYKFNFGNNIVYDRQEQKEISLDKFQNKFIIFSEYIDLPENFEIIPTFRS